MLDVLLPVIPHLYPADDVAQEDQVSLSVLSLLSLISVDSLSSPQSGINGWDIRVRCVALLSCYRFFVNNIAGSPFECLLVDTSAHSKLAGDGGSLGLSLRNCIYIGGFQEGTYVQGR